MEQTYKIVLVGAGGVGKNSLVLRLLGLNVVNKYIATLGVEVHPLRVHTNKGVINLNMWSCAGQEKFMGLADGYYINAHGAIGMFDDAPSSKEVLKSRLIDFYRVRSPHHYKVVVVQNKSDLIPREVKKQRKEPSAIPIISTRYDTKETLCKAVIEPLLREITNDLSLVVLV